MCEESVSPDQICTFSIYTGIKALYWVTHSIFGLVISYSTHHIQPNKCSQDLVLLILWNHHIIYSIYGRSSKNSLYIKWVPYLRGPKRGELDTRVQFPTSPSRVSLLTNWSLYWPFAICDNHLHLEKRDKSATLHAVPPLQGFYWPFFTQHTDSLEKGRKFSWFRFQTFSL